jgi:hypothetical protein
MSSMKIIYQWRISMSIRNQWRNEINQRKSINRRRKRKRHAAIMAWRWLAKMAASKAGKLYGGNVWYRKKIIEGWRNGNNENI